MSSLLIYFLLGVLIGAATGIPIGPVNVAVIDAAYRHNVRRAVAVGFGGAVADLVYALIGIVGVGPMLVKNPSVPPILYAISGVVLIVYGILTVRAQAVDPAPAGASEENSARDLWGGFLLGVGLIFLNPATLVTWVVIVGAAMAGVTFAEGISAAIGIGVGSLGWFTLVAYLADHGKKVLGKKAIWITRVVGMALIAYGIFSIGRAVHYLFKEVL